MNVRYHLALIAGLVFTASGAAASYANDLAEQEERAMKSAMAKIQPSVVRIETFGGLETVGRILVGTGPTTGLIVSPDGHIVSSAFNFVQKPTSILVTLPSGRRAAARIVARDRSRMIVLLKVDVAEPLEVPEIVSRKDIVVGQWAIAIGRALDPSTVSISAGIVSATDRVWGKAIQTDAKVSPSNYGGPLVDIRGRVLGLLVPLSPQGKDEIAGAEWYDSGIGFAIPLDDILQRMNKLKQGQDLLPGLLGVGLKSQDMYVDEVVIAACPANGPAAKAGLKPDDKIVEFDGVPIVRQAQLRHALGRRYAGETVSVVVLRAGRRVEAAIQLVDQLVPYAHPFLGVLPMRDKSALTVRFVFADSAAARAGLAEGDVITRFAKHEITDADALRERLLAFEPGQEVDLEFSRGGKILQTRITLGTLPTEIPVSLPPARTAQPEPAEVQPPLGVVEIKIPEESSQCIAYIPESYQAESPCGLVVWLHAPERFQRAELVRRWKPLCDANQLILLAPQSSDPSKWQATDAEFIRKTISDLRSNYSIDEHRIILHGHQGGGTMAYLAGFSQVDVVRGIATVDAVVPARSRPPANDPAHRLAFFNARAAGSPLAERIDADVERLGRMEYPVTVQNLGPTARYLNAEELERLLRWLDTLDRI